MFNILQTHCDFDLSMTSLEMLKQPQVVSKRFYPFKNGFSPQLIVHVFKICTSSFSLLHLSPNAKQIKTV